MGRLENPDRPAYHLRKQYFLMKTYTRLLPGLSNPDRSFPELPRGLEGDNAARAYVSASRPARAPAGARQGLGAGTACAACPPGAARPAHAAGFYDTKDPESRV